MSSLILLFYLQFILYFILLYFTYLILLYLMWIVSYFLRFASCLYLENNYLILCGLSVFIFGCLLLVLENYKVTHYILGLDQNIRLFEYSFGGLAFDFQFWDSNILFFFFFFSPDIPRETVLNLSAWLNICTSNRPFANERRSCWPLTCIYFMKNLLLWARLPHIYIWNNELKRSKDATCERTLCYHKTECDACMRFLCQLSRDAEWKSWISVQ